MSAVDFDKSAGSMYRSPWIDLGASPSIFSSGESIKNLKLLLAGSTANGCAVGAFGIAASSADAVGASFCSAALSLLQPSAVLKSAAHTNIIRFRCIMFSLEGRPGRRHEFARCTDLSPIGFNLSR